MHVPADDARGKNPYGGLNVGVVELEDRGDRDALRFSRVGCAAESEEPVTVFRTAAL